MVIFEERLKNGTTFATKWNDIQSENKYRKYNAPFEGQNRPRDGSAAIAKIWSKY